MNKPKKRAGMNLITQTVTRWVAGPIVLYGIHILFTGHLAPGSGFDGGIIIACAFVLITLSFGAKFALGRLGKLLASKLSSLGAMLFLTIAFLGYTGYFFFRNFIQTASPTPPFQIFSAGTILLSNVALGIMVGASFFMAFIILAVVRVVTDKDSKMKMIQRSQDKGTVKSKMKENDR